MALESREGQLFIDRTDDYGRIKQTLTEVNFRHHIVADVFKRKVHRLLVYKHNSLVGDAKHGESALITAVQAIDNAFARYQDMFELPGFGSAPETELGPDRLKLAFYFMACHHPFCLPYVVLEVYLI
jgi:hypothetical protein